MFLSRKQILIRSSAICWGLVIQFCTFATFMPLHLAIHLATSPTVSSRKAKDFAIEQPTLLGIPLSMAIGFFIPAIMLALPAPSIQTYSQKQIWLAAWQVFPVYFEIVQGCISFVIARFEPPTTTLSHTQPMRNGQTIDGLRVSLFQSILPCQV